MPGVYEILCRLTKEISEQPTVVDGVQCEPVLLGLDPNQQVLKHSLKLRDQLRDVSLDVCGVLRADERVQRRQVFFNGVGHEFAIRQHIIVDLLLEWYDIEARLIPLLLNRQKNCFVLGLGRGVLDDQPNVGRILLNIEFLEVHDGEGCGVFQMRRFEQGKDLRPVPALERVLVHLLDEVHEHGRVLDLTVDHAGDGLRLVRDELGVGGELIEVLGDLGDRFQNKAHVILNELRGEALVALPAPVQEHLPHLDCALVHLFHELLILRTRQLFLLELALGVRLVLIQNFEEFLVQDNFALHLHDRLRTPQELIQSFFAPVQALLVLKVSFNVLLFEGLDLETEAFGAAEHRLLDVVFVSVEVVLRLLHQLGQVSVETRDLLNTERQL